MKKTLLIQVSNLALARYCFPVHIPKGTTWEGAYKLMVDTYYRRRVLLGLMNQEDYGLASMWARDMLFDLTSQYQQAQRETKTDVQYN